MLSPKIIFFCFFDIQRQFSSQKLTKCDKLSHFDDQRHQIDFYRHHLRSYSSFRVVNISIFLQLKERNLNERKKLKIFAKKGVPGGASGCQVVPGGAWGCQDNAKSVLGKCLDVIG